MLESRVAGGVRFSSFTGPWTTSQTAGAAPTAAQGRVDLIWACAREGNGQMTRVFQEPTDMITTGL